MTLRTFFFGLNEFQITFHLFLSTDQPSFFDFFTPPVLPDDPEDPNFSDINVSHDFRNLRSIVLPDRITHLNPIRPYCRMTLSWVST